MAFAALTAEIGFSVRAFAQSEASTLRLTLALQNQGLYSDALLQKYKDIASEIEKKTGIDDDQIVATQALIQSLIGQREVTEPLIKAIVDLSIVKNQDLQSTAELIAKGINGHAKGLQNLGLHIDEHLTKEQKLIQITEQVNQKFAGFAQASNQGLGGMKGLLQAFDQVQKAIGSEFAPLMSTAIQRTTDFLREVANNESLVRLIAMLLAGGAALTGLIATLSTAGIAVVSFNAITAALGVTMTAALGPLGLLIAGVTAVGAAIGYFAIKTDDSKLSAKGLEERVVTLKEKVKQLQDQTSDPGRALWFGKTKADLEAAQKELASYEDRLNKLKAQSSTKEGEQKQDPKKAELAAKEEAENRAREKREQDALKAHNQLIHLEATRASAESINLQKADADIEDKIADEKYKKERKALESRHQELLLLKKEQFGIEVGQRDEFQNEILAKNEEYQKLDDNQKKLFLLKNQQQLQGQLLTEKTAKQEIAKKQLEDDIKAHNTFLVEQQKYGTAYAEINKAMHSQVYEGTKEAFGNLAELQQSSNSTLKAIGKVAAVANIVIKTAESAMNIYAGFSTIPFVGQALGIAAAAAAVAFGGEQIGKVNAANAGGIVPGFGPDRDSTLSLLTPGELVVPRSNFNEVVNSVAASRSGALLSGSSQSGGAGDDRVVSLLDSIDQKLSEPRIQYNINGDVWGNTDFLDKLLQMISDRVQYKNARLLASAVRG